MRPKPYSVRTGAIAEEINTVARVTRAELIAIATRGDSGINALFWAARQRAWCEMRLVRC